MSKPDAMHICRKQELWALIRALGRLYGESEEGIREFAKECYEAHRDDLEGAIACFRDLVERSKWMERVKNPWGVATVAGVAVAPEEKPEQTRIFRSHAEYSANDK